MDARFSEAVSSVKELERGSVALTLVPPPDSRNPAAVYLAALAPSGRRTMGQALAVIVELLGGGDVRSFPWSSLRYEHAQAVRRVLVDRYAPATANKILSALRGVAREAWRLGLVDAETHARIRDVPGVRGSRLPAGREVPIRELAKLFRACAEAGSSGVRDAAAMALLYGTGLRRSEAVGLDVDAFDGSSVRVLGKGNKERSVPVPAAAAAALRAWLELRSNAPGPLLCPVRGRTVTLRRMSSQAVMTALLRRAGDAGVPHLSPHDLRRSYITGLLRAGADLSTVQRLAGHASVTTTTRYDRRGDDEKVKAVQLLHVPYVPAAAQKDVSHTQEKE
jgi:site-specific recombinase XerD